MIVEVVRMPMLMVVMHGVSRVMVLMPGLLLRVVVVT